LGPKVSCLLWKLSVEGIQVPFQVAYKPLDSSGECDLLFLENFPRSEEILRLRSVGSIGIRFANLDCNIFIH